MRLINTDTLQMVEYDHSRAPSYAILSHTWGDSEVSFEDIMRAGADQTAVSTKPGFRKIANFCKEARSRGFMYGWVDKCCIDKRNSAELSEAINSMYRYYSSAAVCLIYLGDVHKSMAGADSPNQLFESVSRSRWLSRGWTLQELTASTMREFFDAEWNLIVDDDDELLGVLSKAARIPISALDRTIGIHEYCVAERMSWASNRQTTRGEDMAYCLMGIFDVNMPILYGEGGTKAFKRLQAEIMKDSFDQTLFAWRGPYSSSGLLAERPFDFANTPEFELWTRHHLSPYQMTNIGLSIQVLDVTRGLGGERLKELRDLGLIPPEKDHSVILAALQCEVLDNPRDFTAWGLGIRLQALDGSFRSINGSYVRGYQRINCDKFYPVPLHLMTGAEDADVLVLDNLQAIRAKLWYR